MMTSLIFLFISSLCISYCIGSNSYSCPEIEKLSLLSFKKSLNDPNKLLSSWDAEADCCEWEGVICSNLTGHVHQLHLRSLQSEGSKGKMNPSLLNLKYLRYVDLSDSYLFGETIPSFIGSFANLEYLNLSGAGFHGKVPHTIGNLSNLHTLDLGGIQDNLVVDSLEWLSGLSRLEYLNMNSVDLYEAKNWAQVINSLPSLVDLHFDYCDLDFMAPLNEINVTTSLKYLYLATNFRSYVTIPHWIFQLTNLLFVDLSNSFFGPIPTISNATKLQHIDLSVNALNSSIPDWFYRCKNLTFVDLSNNLLSGAISNSIANLTSLNTLRASNNLLSGKIPREIVTLCKIQSLDLFENNFQGDISYSFGNMSECYLETLEHLNLMGNKLSGHLTNQFGEFKGLQYLDLGYNSLSGVIPINIGKLSSLEYLSLHDNQFTGTLPKSLGQLFNLRRLYIDKNKLEGVMTESHFANLTKLDALLASGNRLSLNVSPNWNPPFQLTIIGLASWNLGVGSKIPSWLEKQKSIWNLDLSNTGISGYIPSYFWKIQFLSLSHNHLHGKIPYLHGPQDQYISLGSNQFRGPLPRIADTVGHLDLSNNSFSGGVSKLLCDTTYNSYGLRLLHLGGNQLSGYLPDCWTKWPSLGYLNLGKNNMTGSIPNSIGHLIGLESLNLYGNRLFGEIPLSMQNCTELVKVDLSDNALDGSLPTWGGTYLVSLTFLILHSNKLSGEISSEICRLKSLQILDLSNNKISGIIPRCLYNFTAMSTKSLGGHDAIYSYDWGFVIESASVVIKGSKLQYEFTLSLVTNIDLSSNNLSGDIPKELTSLVELRSLNLSQNRLTGSIPEKIGDMRQLESLDFSMNSLSGQIPSSFKLLSFLEYLNLSHNKLTGRIPESTQLQGFDASGFSGNDLCGPPLTIKCSGDGDDERDGQKEENEEESEDESKIEWFYVVLSLGYAVGFSAVCSALVLNKSWRETYFGLFERMWDEFYVYVHIKWIKLAKPSHPTS